MRLEHHLDHTDILWVTKCSGQDSITMGERGSTELRAARSRPQPDQMERLMPLADADAEAGQDLRAFPTDGLQRPRRESQQLQDRRGDLGRFHRAA